MSLEQLGQEEPTKNKLRFQKHVTYLSGRRATTNKNLVLTGFLWYHSVYLLCVLGAVYVHFEKAQLSFNIHNHTLKKLIWHFNGIARDQREMKATFSSKWSLSIKAFLFCLQPQVCMFTVCGIWIIWEPSGVPFSQNRSKEGFLWKTLSHTTTDFAVIHSPRPISTESLTSRARFRDAWQDEQAQIGEGRAKDG